MVNLKEAYPTLSQLLEGTEFETDALQANACGKTPRDLQQALVSKEFKLNELMWVLCGPFLYGWSTSEIARLEKDLLIIVSNVGIDFAKNAFKDKFLVEAKSREQDANRKTLDAKNKLEDVCYELAVTAKACDAFDKGSIQLEKPIPNPVKQETQWKNSDVYGTFCGQPVRIEVTVLHENLPPAIHVELDDFVRKSKVTSGFSTTLRSVLSGEGYAERVRALVELLHENHLSTNGKSLEIDGIQFAWNGSAYHCHQENSPFVSICFYAANEFPNAEMKREIINPCITRAVTPQHIIEDHPNPPGVFTSADVPNASAQVPVSTKIKQMLSGKLQQCEDGTLNIIAFGNPLPMHDSEVENAVLGAESIGIESWIDKHGVRHSGRMFIERSFKAPFAPARRVKNDDDKLQFIAPFKKLSAVWLLRLGPNARSKMIKNPNAENPVSDRLLAIFNETTSQVVLGNNLAGARVPSLSYKEPLSLRSEIVSPAKSIVWNEVAGDLVSVCGTISKARLLISELKQKGLSLEEITSMDDKVWSEANTKGEGLKFLSPTNEEMAVRFVANCGGFVQAYDCLEKYAREVRLKDDL